MEDVKISVIVPVYNAEKTIDYCVQSIIQQTYKNLEIILVENGSTDNSLQKCKEYAEKDDRVKVFVSEKGVSKARNLGLEKMTGTYFAFVDSDDYIDITTYEKCLKKAVEEDADMTFYLTNSVQGDNITKFEEKNIEKVVYGNETKYFFYKGSESVRTGTIRVLFLAEKHKDLRYDEDLCFSEDFIFMIESMKKSEKRALVKEHMYYNVNFHNVPFTFARKYQDRHNFYESARIFSFYAQNYLQETGNEEIMYAHRFDNLILMINAIVGIKKNWLKEIKKFVKEPYWKESNNKTAYKQYLKITETCGKVVKLKAWLVYHKLYFAYGVMAKTYARMKGVR